MAFAIGISLIAIGLLFVIWTTVLRNRRTTDTTGEELERAESDNRTAQQSVASAQSTAASIEQLIIAAGESDQALAEAVGNITTSVGKLSDSVDESSNIFETIRKQKVD